MRGELSQIASLRHIIITSSTSGCERGAERPRPRSRGARAGLRVPMVRVVCGVGATHAPPAAAVGDCTLIMEHAVYFHPAAGEDGAVAPLSLIHI